MGGCRSTQRANYSIFPQEVILLIVDNYRPTKVIEKQLARKSIERACNRCGGYHVEPVHYYEDVEIWIDGDVKSAVQLRLVSTMFAKAYDTEYIQKHIESESQKNRRLCPPVNISYDDPYNVSHVFSKKKYTYLPTQDGVAFHFPADTLADFDDDNLDLNLDLDLYPGATVIPTQTFGWASFASLYPRLISSSHSDFETQNTDLIPYTIGPHAIRSLSISTPIFAFRNLNITVALSSEIFEKYKLAILTFLSKYADEYEKIKIIVNQIDRFPFKQIEDKPIIEESEKPNRAPVYSLSKVRHHSQRKINATIMSFANRSRGFR